MGLKLGLALISNENPNFKCLPIHIPEKLFFKSIGPNWLFGFIPFVTRPAHRCTGRKRRGGCLSPATSGASSGASGRCGDGTANPKGSWHGRFLLVPFSCDRARRDTMSTKLCKRQGRLPTIGFLPFPCPAPSIDGVNGKRRARTVCARREAGDGSAPACDGRRKRDTGLFGSVFLATKKVTKDLKGE